MMKKMFMMELKNSVKAPLRTTSEDRRKDGMVYVGKDEDDKVFGHDSNNGLKAIHLKQKIMWGSGHGCDLYGSFNVASNQGWGIPPGFGLRGGGLNSLNNGTSGWGAPPSNSSAASATGWGAPPGSASVVGSGSSSSGVVGSGQSSVAAATSSSSPGGLVNTPANNQQVNPSPANNNHPGGSSQWASTSPNRNTSQNTNGQPTISGSQMNNNPSSNATSVPTSGNPMQMGNQNVNNVMGNNTPNSPMNPGSVGTNPNQNSGPGGTNSGGLITNSGTSSWAQAAGKSLQPTSGNSNTMNNVNNPSNTSAMSNNPNAMNPSSVNPGVTGHGPPMSGINSAPTPGGSGNSSVTSKQIEQLNSMRDALFSHDGWGGQNVNQDSGWDIPGSPEPQHKDLGGIAAGSNSSTGAANWKVNVNNGTDLWEANLRNGGAPPPQPATQKAPWGHTPSTNIGGTWGEEDDGADSSNVWSGVPPPATNAPGPNAAPPNNNSSGGNSNSGQMQWGSMNNGPQQPPPQREPPNGMWPNSAPVKKEPNDWSSNMGRGHGGHDLGRGHDSAPSGWGDRNNARGGMNSGNMGVDPNQGMWNKPPPQQQPPQPQNQWGTGPPGGHGNIGNIGGPGNHGGHVGMKDKPSNSGWDDVSPPTQRRAVPNIPNYDDGTSLWGNPMPNQQQQQQQQPPPQQQQRMPPNRGMPNKMDGVGNPMWGHGGGGNRNGWNGPEGPQDGFNSGGGGWNDDKNNGGSWGEPPMQQQQQHNSWGKPKTPTNPASGWGDDSLVDTSSWGGTHKNPRSRHDTYANGNGNYAKDASRPLKILADLGYKKEDLELALRSSHMNLSDAIDTLDNLTVAGGGRGGPPMDQSPWAGGPLQPQQQRRGPPPVGPGPEDHFDLSGLGVGPGGGPMGMGHPPQQRGGFPNPGGFPGANSIINNVANPSLASINPSLIQKILTQQQPNPPQAFNAQRGVQPNNPTSPGQLRVLVQQIQMAVQAGYLSSQILQHPLPQQSLYLLNQLLQQIKIFQQVTQAQQQIGKTNSAAALQLSVQITKTKQQINNLHNQIAAQQALHAKQQQQQQQQQQHNHLMAAAAAAAANKPTNDFFNNPPILPNTTGSVMDPMMSALQSNFGSDFGLKESGQHQQSRLTQWTKVPSLEKDDANNPGNEFSRAPGPQSNNSSSLLKNNSSFNLGQSDNTWSSVAPRSGSDGWPTDHPPTTNSSGNNNPNMNMNDDANKSNSAVNVNISSDAWPSDLVPEFEPGKPWKGTQIMKSVEDDPTITPGSVVRSPLSLAAIKDNSEIFSKNAPSTAASSMASDSLVTPLSLSSNTWSFTPTSSSSSGIANNMAKLNSTKGVWDDMRPRDLWDYGTGANSGNVVPGSRPPPGLPKKTGGPTTAVPAASGNVTSGTNSNSFNSYRNNSSNISWGTNQGGGMSHFWLLLRNLTPQIDGSTLKTLCLQHGPLQNFHLYLSHGVALVRYASREEAAKAQNALNNCVLGNTTILAETAGEGDVHNLIQGLNGSAAVNNSQSASNNAGISSGNTNSRQSSNDNPWNVLRDNSPLWSSSPWGSAGLDAPDRATPSSLNSLLPGDLLGGESA